LFRTVTSFQTSTFHKVV